MTFPSLKHFFSPLMSQKAHETRKQMNSLGESRTPFVFLIDFELQNPKIWKWDTFPLSNIVFNLNGTQTGKVLNQIDPHFDLEKFPIDFYSYKNGFDLVLDNINRGNSYLTNYTRRTRVKSPHSLSEIYAISNAPYKFLMKDEFMCFSPEIFIRIEEEKIKSFPMKGTINSDIPGAQSIIMADQKETAEHITIVDLIRNDLSRVAQNVKVTRFRYLDHIRSSTGGIYQVSSEIQGDLNKNYVSNLGDIIYSLLPAGSISGAPKRKTVEIIQEAEQLKRGFYTGVMGFFDGKNLDSAVMIRFLKQEKEGLYFYSGGGITSSSVAEKEYQEMIDKVYIPLA